jgi:hypothetical protein
VAKIRVWLQRAAVSTHLSMVWLLYLLCLLGIAGMVVMTMDFIPKGYRILSFTDMFPLGLVLGSHLLLPLVLNRKC